MVAGIRDKGKNFNSIGVVECRHKVKGEGQGLSFLPWYLTMSELGLARKLWAYERGTSREYRLSLCLQHQTSPDLPGKSPPLHNRRLNNTPSSVNIELSGQTVRMVQGKQTASLSSLVVPETCLII